MFMRRLGSLPGWSNPFRELDEMRREMTRLFEGYTPFAGFPTAGVFPPIHVSSTGDEIRVRAELPGIDPKDLDVRVENNTLTIAGERKQPHESKDVSYHRREREWGSFRRSLTLPHRVEADGVQARYEDGILTVDLPKAHEIRPRQITVHAGG